MPWRGTAGCGDGPAGTASADRPVTGVCRQGRAELSYSLTVLRPATGRAAAGVRPSRCSREHPRQQRGRVCSSGRAGGSGEPPVWATHLCRDPPCRVSKRLFPGAGFMVRAMRGWGPSAPLPIPLCPGVPHKVRPERALGSTRCPSPTSAAPSPPVPPCPTFCPPRKTRRGRLSSCGSAWCRRPAGRGHSSGRTAGPWRTA